MCLFHTKAWYCRNIWKRCIYKYMFYIMVAIDCRVQTLHVLIVVNFVWLKNPKSIRKKLSNTTGIPFLTHIFYLLNMKFIRKDNSGTNYCQENNSIFIYKKSKRNVVFDHSLRVHEFECLYHEIRWCADLDGSGVWGLVGLGSSSGNFRPIWFISIIVKLFKKWNGPFSPLSRNLFFSLVSLLRKYFCLI